MTSVAKIQSCIQLYNLITFMEGFKQADKSLSTTYNNRISASQMLSVKQKSETDSNLSQAKIQSSV